MRCSSDLVSFVDLEIGKSSVIRQLQGEISFIQRLREVGLSEGTSITKVAGRGPYIVKLETVRIALNHNAACCIVVSM